MLRSLVLGALLLALELAATDVASAAATAGQSCQASQLKAAGRFMSGDFKCLSAFYKNPLADPEKLRQFGSFVNAPEHADDSLAYVAERGQARPATEAERRTPGVLIAGTTLEVRR